MKNRNKKDPKGLFLPSGFPNYSRLEGSSSLFLTGENLLGLQYKPRFTSGSHALRGNPV